MTSIERVMAALDFRPPDRVPRFESFWPEFEARWRAEKGLGPEADIGDYYRVDIAIAAGDEGVLPSQAGALGERDGYAFSRSSWGEVTRRREGGYFYQQVATLIDAKADLDRVTPDPPDMPGRYAGLDAQMDALKRRFCVFAKTGGPFIRSQFLRGEERLLMDMADDPVFAAELFLFTARHLAAIGVEELRRWGLQDTGIWIYDDVAGVKGPLFSPRMAQRLLAPAWAHMIQAYRAAGARKVVLHSDGNISPLLDLFVDLGVDGINPVEPRAAMDVVALRTRYGDRLALVGGLDNAGILPSGDRAAIREHVRRCLSIADEGGLIIGSHSIGPDVSVATYDYVSELIDVCRTG